MSPISRNPRTSEVVNHHAHHLRIERSWCPIANACTYKGVVTPLARGSHASQGRDPLSKGRVFTRGQPPCAPLRARAPAPATPRPAARGAPWRRPRSMRAALRPRGAALLPAEGLKAEHFFLKRLWGNLDNNSFSGVASPDMCRFIRAHQFGEPGLVSALKLTDLIRKSVYDKNSGSTKITTRLDHNCHCKTTSGTNWSTRWTYRVFIINNRHD